MSDTKKRPGFWLREVWPRRRRILRDRGLWVSFILSGLFILIAGKIPLGTVPVETLANSALLYAALSFGAAMAGAGVALGVPGEDRIRRWSLTTAKSTSFSAFENLIFAFVWSATVQLAVVIVAFLAIAFGTGFNLVPPSGGILVAPIHFLCAFISLWLWWYALFELFIVIKTFMSVAGVITKEQRTKR